MNGKGKNRNYIVTFHMNSTGYTDCRGVYKTFEKALGIAYAEIYNKKLREKGYFKDFEIDLPAVTEGHNAWIIHYRYTEVSDPDNIQDDEYYLIYDNEMSDEDLKRLADRGNWNYRLESAKKGKYWTSEEVEGKE